MMKKLIPVDDFLIMSIIMMCLVKESAIAKSGYFELLGRI
jgi:hypothetical protein